MALPILNGFSGTPDSQTALLNIINATAKYHCNAYRIAFTPSWTTGSRTYSAERIAMVDYWLANTPYYIIIDRNHHLGASDVMNWAQAETDIFEVLSRWGNNPKAVIEIVNEYGADAVNDGSDFYSKCQAIINNVRSAGYNNIIGACRFRPSVQPWTVFTDPLNKAFQGMHFYFNTETGGYSVSGAEWNLNGANQAFSKGITDIYNTEIGASWNEASDFTAANVQRVNDFLAWSKTNNVGNFVWMNHDLNNLPTYESTPPYLQFDGGYYGNVTIPYHDDFTNLNNFQSVNGTWSV